MEFKLVLQQNKLILYYLKIFIYLKGREVFHPLVTPPNPSRTGKGLGPKPGVQNSIQASHMGGRVLSA